MQDLDLLLDIPGLSFIKWCKTLFFSHSALPLFSFLMKKRQAAFVGISKGRSPTC